MEFQIIIQIVIVYIIVFYASKQASTSALKKYDKFQKISLIELRLKELLALKIIDQVEYELAIDHYLKLNNSKLRSDKVEKYKSIILELDSNKILQQDNCNSRIFDLENMVKDQ